MSKPGLNRLNNYVYRASVADAGHANQSEMKFKFDIEAGFFLFRVCFKASATDFLDYYGSCALGLGWFPP